jgi:hypothetical protein
MSEYGIETLTHCVLPMKTIILLSIVCAMVLLHPSLSAQPQAPTPEDTVETAKRQYVLAEIAGFPFNFVHSGSWQPYQSFRGGYGRELGYLLELGIYAEYTQYDFDNHDGLSRQDYSQGQRRDYAVYPSIIAFRILEVGFGGYYTTQDEITHQTLFSSQLEIQPGVKKFVWFMHYGARGTIHLYGPVNCTLGIFWRDGSKHFGCRAGVKIEM